MKRKRRLKMEKNITITEKEIIETFVATIESVEDVCNKTTSGNVSHNIATIKGKCRTMLQFYKEFPANPWHSVADGEIPLSYVDCLFAHGEGQVDRGYMLDCECVLFPDGSTMIDIEDVKCWMEIPPIPEERDEITKI